MMGPSKAKPRPKMRVEMEEVGREILLSYAGGGSGPGAAPQLKEPPPGGSTGQVTVGNNNRSVQSRSLLSMPSLKVSVMPPFSSTDLVLS